MTVYIALLRAVNVGGTGMLAMKDLSRMCTGLGFESVRTYIQSGNVVFKSRLARTRVLAALERALNAHMGKKIDVVLREASELRRVLEANPFREFEPSKVTVAFCAMPVDKKACAKVVAPGGERVVAAAHEIYVYYPDGMGRSKLKLPITGGAVTVRNINTVTKLLAIADETASQ
jgi:uncharacterized protein (DUF1697 family)